MLPVNNVSLTAAILGGTTKNTSRTTNYFPWDINISNQVFKGILF